MKHILSNVISPNEQKILLFLIFFLLLGSVLKSMGYQAGSSETADTLELEEDYLLNIDIRSAPAKQLMALASIGERRAADIIAYREQHPFQNVNELLNVKGIGIKTYRKILPDLLVFGDTLAMQQSSSSHSERAEENTAVVNINTAGLEELCTLSGIGIVKATAIINYREENGPFQSPEDLSKVKGIGPATLKKNLSRLKL